MNKKMKLIDGTSATNGKKYRESDEYKNNMRQIVADFNSGDAEKRENAIEAMVNELNGFIGLMINKHFGSYKQNHYEDLHAAGVLAIIENMGNFDIDKGTATTWFTNPIKHAMTELISSTLYESTPYYAGIMQDIKDAQKYFEEKHIIPTVLDLSTFTGYTVKVIEDGLKRIEATTKCYYQSSEELDGLLSKTTETPESYILEMERNQTLYAALSAELTEDDRKILYYVVDANMKDKKISWNQVAKSLHLSVQAVKNSYNRSIRLLYNNPVLQDLEGRSSLHRKENALKSGDSSTAPDKNVINIFANFDDSKPLEINININQDDKDDEEPFIISVS